jgi:hypothetical protein
VIGVSDTGIDMNSCYFYDPACATPYSKDGSVVDKSCRKVIQVRCGRCHLECHVLMCLSLRCISLVSRILLCVSHRRST